MCTNFSTGLHWRLFGGFSETPKIDRWSVNFRNWPYKGAIPDRRSIFRQHFAGENSKILKNFRTERSADRSKIFENFRKFGRWSALKIFFENFRKSKILIFVHRVWGPKKLKIFSAQSPSLCTILGWFLGRKIAFFRSRKGFRKKWPLKKPTKITYRTYCLLWNNFSCPCRRLRPCVSFKIEWYTGSDPKKAQGLFLGN